MPIDTANALVGALRQYRLLESDQLNEVVRDLQPRFAEPRSLAKELMQRGWLTPFQINRLFQARFQELVLGSYLLLEPLGEGGMGTVYKARHLRLDRIDAVKVIRKNFLSNANAVERFHREARAAARLAHANVVTIYDASEVNGVHFLAMEYVAGIDLSRLVKQSGPLAVTQACDYIRQAALGLQHAHDKGLIHRDVKPSNLLLTQAPQAQGLPPLGVVKVLDLGLARLGSVGAASADHSLTETGSVVGTPDYIAPEQARNARNIDGRADVYSLGCAFYYLLSGTLPFPGETLTEKLLKHQLEEPPAIEQARPSVPPGVALVVRRMMAKRPEDRYQTPAEVAAALHPFIPSTGIAVAIPMAQSLAEPSVLESSRPLEMEPPSTGNFSKTVPVGGDSSAGAGRRLHLVIGGLAGAVVLLFGTCGLLLWSFLSGNPSRPATGSVAVRPTAPGKATTSATSKSDPQTAQAHVERGNVNLTAKRYDQAIADFTDAIRLDPNNVTAHFRRASAYYEKGDYDKCLADNNRVIQLKADYAPAYNNRGILYIRRGQLDLAIAEFTEAIRLEPKYAGAYGNRGRAHLSRPDYDKAIADFNDALRIAPTDAGHWNDLGVAHLNKGDLDTALTDFSRAIQYDGKLAIAYLNRSRVHEKKGNRPQAETDRKKALALDPNVERG